MHLATAQVGVGRDIKDVHDELRDGVSSNPEKDVLAVLEEEEPVALEAFAREGQRQWEHDAVLADRAALQASGQWLGQR